MFDANAAYIKNGELFFAEARNIDSQLADAGVMCGTIILCSHVEKQKGSRRENLVSDIWISKDSEPFRYVLNKNWSWLVYSGKPNGTDFIDDKWKAEALKFLGGTWIK